MPAWEIKDVVTMSVAVLGACISLATFYLSNKPKLDAARRKRRYFKRTLAHWRWSSRIDRAEDFQTIAVESFKHFNDRAAVAQGTVTFFIPTKVVFFAQETELNGVVVPSGYHVYDVLKPDTVKILAFKDGEPVDAFIHARNNVNEREDHQERFKAVLTRGKHKVQFLP